MKILIMGLPGSGKTWLGNKLSKHFSIPIWDADVIRGIYNDWDFSEQGRHNQTMRMRALAEIDAVSISAFICPLPAYRSFFMPDKIIWMDTIKDSKYEDTNKIFIPPKNSDVRITKWIEENQLYKCLEDISLGTMDTESFSNGLMERLAKL
jgi:adenylylsulfate kinase